MNNSRFTKRKWLFFMVRKKFFKFLQRFFHLNRLTSERAHKGPMNSFIKCKDLRWKIAVKDC